MDSFVIPRSGLSKPIPSAEVATSALISLLIKACSKRSRSPASVRPVPACVIPHDRDLLVRVPDHVGVGCVTGKQSGGT